MHRRRKPKPRAGERAFAAASVIPAKAGIQCLVLDSGSPFHSARNDVIARSGWYLLPIRVFPHPLNRLTVIPAKAGIQYLVLDSGSPFHCARNDVMARSGWYLLPIRVFPHPLNRLTVIPAKAGIQYLGIDSGSPFHSARNDVMERSGGIRSLSGYSHPRRMNPPSFPRKRESNASAWIPGLRFTAPGMTGKGRFLSPLRRRQGHGWRPALLGPAGLKGDADTAHRPSPASLVRLLQALPRSKPFRDDSFRERYAIS